MPMSNDYKQIDPAAGLALRGRPFRNGVAFQGYSRRQAKFNKRHHHGRKSSGPNDDIRTRFTGNILPLVREETHNFG